MCWLVKIFLYASFFIQKEPISGINTFQNQLCHFDWAENFVCQLELKPNEPFYFLRSVSVYKAAYQKTDHDFISGTYESRNDTLILTIGASTHQFVKEKNIIIYLVEGNDLVFTGEVKLVILPNRLDKTNRPKIFKNL